MDRRWTYSEDGNDGLQIDNIVDAVGIVMWSTHWTRILASWIRFPDMHGQISRSLLRIRDVGIRYFMASGQVPTTGLTLRMRIHAVVDGWSNGAYSSVVTSATYSGSQHVVFEADVLTISSSSLGKQFYNILFVSGLFNGGRPV